MNTGALTARLTRSKTIGADRGVSFRMAHVASCCLFCRAWLAGSRVDELSGFPRDYLLQAPAPNYSGCLRADLPYDTTCAIKNRFLSSLQREGQQLILKGVLNFWTPHSSRTCVPSAKDALSVPKEQRDYLDAWSALGTPYERLQKLVIKAVQE